MIATLQTADRAALLIWTKVLVFVFVVFATVSPFNAPLAAGGGFFLQAFWIARDHGDLRQRLRDSVVTRAWLTFAVFFIYLALRIYQPPLTIASLEAIPGVSIMGIFALMIFATCALFPYQNDDVQKAIAHAFLAAFVAAAALHAFEIASDLALRRQLWHWVPATRPRPGKIELDGDQVKVLVVFLANPSSAILAALFWPALLLTRCIKLTRVKRVMIGLGAVLCGYAIFRSDQATSKMALACGGATWALVSLLPRTVRPLLSVIWIASNVLVLPAALYAYHNDFYKLPRNFSAQHRIVLWGVTAEKTLEHPWFGIGTGKTADFDASTSPDVANIPGTRIPIATNRHAHNVFLQLWYEDGAVGVLLFILAGLPVIGWISTAPQRSQALLAAAFSAAVMSASFSYSLIAAWFLATFTITALFCRFAVSLAPD